MDTRNITDITHTANWRYQPNLSYIGMQQAIMLGINYMTLNAQKYDIILSSASLRTVMTALLSLRQSPPNKIIYVCPYITEFVNISDKGGYDYQNNQLSSAILKRFIKFIKEWLKDNWLEYYDDIEIILKLKELKSDINDDNDSITKSINNILECKPNIILNNNNIYKPWMPYTWKLKEKPKIYKSMTDRNDCKRNLKTIFDACKEKLKSTNRDNIKLYTTLLYFSELGDNVDTFIQGPKIDFSILEHFEKTDTQKYTMNETSCDVILNKFYTNVLPYIKNNIFKIKKDTYNICVFTHGNLMRTYFSKKYKKEKPGFLMNTSIYAEELYTNNEFNKFDFKDVNMTKHVPVKLRTQFKNFSSLNMDICRTQSVKGVINHNLFPEGATYASSAWEYVPYVNTVLNADVKFIEGKIKDYLSDQQTDLQLAPVTGGTRYNINRSQSKYYSKYIKYKLKYIKATKNVKS